MYLLPHLAVVCEIEMNRYILFIWLTISISSSWGARNHVLERPCPGLGECYLRLMHQQKPCITSVYNPETKTTVAIDHDSDISILFNGKTGVQVILDLKHETGQFVPKKYTVKQWLAKETPYKNFIEGSNGLEYLKTDEVPAFDIHSQPREHVGIVNDMVDDLEPQLEDITRTNKKAGLPICFKLIKQLHSHGKAHLRKILRRKLRITSTIVHGGLGGIVSTFSGLAELMNRTGGAIEPYLMAPDFKYEPLFLADSGCEKLAIVTDQIDHDTDSTELLKPMLKLPLSLYEIIHKFSGGLYKGLYAIETMIAHLIMFVHEMCPLRTLIDIVIQVGASIGKVTKQRIYRNLDFIIEILNNHVNKYPSTKLLWALPLNFLNNIRKGLLVIKNLNIWSVLEHVLEASRTLTVNIIVKILNQLKNFVGFSHCLAQFFYRLVYFIISGEGFVFIRKLLPSINNGIDFFSKKEPIITQIMKLLNPEKIFGLFLMKPKEILTSIPIIGDIYKAVEEAVRSVGAVGISLIDALVKNDLFKTLLSWIKFGLGLPGGSAPFGNIHGLGCLGGGSTDYSCSLSIINDIQPEYSSLGRAHIRRYKFNEDNDPVSVFNNLPHFITYKKVPENVPNFASERGQDFSNEKEPFEEVSYFEVN